MANWTNINKSTVPSYVNKTKFSGASGLSTGEPLGLLLALTTTAPTDTTWVNSDKSANPTYTNIAKSSSPIYTNINKSSNPSYTNINKS